MDQLNSEMNRNLTIIAIYCISNTVCCLSGWKAYKNYIFLEVESKPSSASHVVDDSFSFKILFTQLNSISNVREWLITSWVYLLTAEFDQVTEMTHFRYCWSTEWCYLGPLTDNMNLSLETLEMEFSFVEIFSSGLKTSTYY